MKDRKRHGRRARAYRDVFHENCSCVFDVPSVHGGQRRVLNSIIQWSTKGKNMVNTSKKKITALVLQGGGALGAYEHGVVKALYENSDFNPDIICGVSIGGFSAAVIGGAKDGPVAGLDQFWQMFTSHNMPFVPHPMQVLMTMPYNAGMYKPNYSGLFTPYSTTHFFDTTPLYRTLHDIIDFKKLNSMKAPNVVVTATNIKRGLSESFNNREMYITDDHIVASGSLPPSFPMVEIDGDHYWDGGLFSNTPLKPAFKCLEKIGDDDCEREIIMVELFPQEGETPHNIADVIERMGSLIFQSKMVFDHKMFNRTKDYIDMVRVLDEELPEGSSLRETSAFKQLMSYSKIDKLTIIQYTGDENMLGITDFTEKTINRRFELGYEDGLRYTTNH